MGVPVGENIGFVEDTRDGDISGAKLASHETGANGGGEKLSSLQERCVGCAANDNGPDGLVVIGASGATGHGGTIQFAGDGAYTYAPATNFFGTDTVGYTAQDPLGSQVSATLTINVGAVDDAPVAQDGSANGNEDMVVTATLVAADVDSVSLTYRAVAQAAHGSVTVNADGTGEEWDESKMKAYPPERSIPSRLRHHTTLGQKMVT